jgi:hypothetical protein
MTAMIEDRSAQSESFREAMRLVCVDGVAVRTARRAPILLSETTFKKHRRGKFDVVIERQIPDALGQPRTMYEVRSQSYDATNGRMRDRRRPSALDAGYMGKGSNDDDPTKTPQDSKAGDGWRAVIASTSAGDIIGVQVGRNGNDDEKTLARALVGSDAFTARTEGTRQAGVAGVLVADSGFSSDHLRKVVQEKGYVPAITETSPKSPKEVRKGNVKQWDIHGYPNWHMNGHCELYCECGHADVTQRITVDGSGLRIGITGVCRGNGLLQPCGSITMTVGQWWAADNGILWLNTPAREPSLRYGNPLTINSHLGRAYGTRRWVSGEAVMSQLRSRWKITDYRRHLTSGRTVLWEILMTSLADHAVGAALDGGLAPPGQSLVERQPRRKRRAFRTAPAAIAA